MAKTKPMGAAQWPQLKEAMRERALSSTFEAQVSRLEQICRNTPGTLPNRELSAPPKSGSHAWFSEEILFAIKSARYHVASGDAAWASAEAISIGVLASQAARLDWPAFRGWRELVDSETKDRALVGAVIQTVAFAGQICLEFPEKHYGIDMEIEFKGDDGRPTGKKVYLQLKSGDSHLRAREKDGREIFDVPDHDHSGYWMAQAFPVFLVIADSQGSVRWMEIRDFLQQETKRLGRIPKSFVFSGDAFTQEGIMKRRGIQLGSSE